jgi:heme exporter protein B
MLGVFLGAVGRDLRLAFRRRGEWANALVFFVIAASLFPLGVGPELALLRTMAPGVVWVCALLASMLALERLFAGDHADGTLEQMLLSQAPLGVIVVGKVLAHWLVAGLPLVLAAPLLALQFGLDGQSIVVLIAALLLGTPTLSLVGAAGAALILGARGGGALLSLMVLPLYIPVLIFGAGAVTASDPRAHLMLLAGMLFLSLALAPWATAAALRIALD